MGYEHRRRSAAVLNLTPLIDIVFLLLIFFMLTSHFIEKQVIPITLPRAETGDDVTRKDFLEVLITPEGELLVDGDPVQPDDLEQTIRGALHAPGVRFVKLRGDQAANFGLAVKVIDAARSAGAESLDIVTRQP